MQRDSGYNAGTDGVLQSILERIPIRVFWKDRDSRYLGCNTLFAKDAGLSEPSELIGRTDGELGWSEQAELYRADDRCVMDSDSPRLAYEEPQTESSGRKRWLRTSKVPLHDGGPEVVGVLGIYEDITAQRNAENALHFAQFASDQAPDGITLVDEDARFRYVNASFCESLGYSGEEVRLLTLPDLVPSLTRERWRAFWQRVQLTGHLAFEAEHRHKDGRLIPVDVSASFAQLGELRYVVAFARCTSERKAAELQLRDSEARYRALLEQSPLATQILAPDGRTLRVNAAWEALWGVPFAALANYNVLEDPQLVAKGIMPDILRAFAGETVVVPALEYDMAGTPSVSGPRRKAWLRTQLYPVRGEDGAVREVVLLHEDLTERKLAQDAQARLQEQLNAVQRMESIGRLAGGVAHDFNNMLGVILGRAKMAMEELDASDSLQQDLAEIVDAAERSADLTRQLLAFARRQVATPVALDLNAKIAATIKIVQRLIGEDIDLVWTPGPNLAPITIDPSQVDQIVTNLCVNARDAIRGAGCIRIETASAASPHGDRGPEAPHDHVALFVSDDGCGMDERTLAHIFEPFFTTKAVGSGAGLGLSTVYGIVKQNGGHIEVTSRPGVGTSYRIYFPARPVERPAGQQARPPDPLGGSETVLLVEDEPAVMRMTRRMLEGLGYVVLCAASPAEALKLAAETTRPVDLLMTDVVMPGISGWELSQQLEALSPRLVSLFISGYTADVISDHGVIESGVHFLQKPFTRAALATKLREVLGTRQTAELRPA